MIAATTVRLAASDWWVLFVFALTVRLGWELGRVAANRLGWAKRTWGPMQCGHCNKWRLGMARIRAHVEEHRAEVEADQIVAMEAARARGFRFPGDPIGGQP